jgi:hypothetical protein
VWRRRRRRRRRRRKEGEPVTVDRESTPVSKLAS